VFSLTAGGKPPSRPELHAMKTDRPLTGDIASRSPPGAFESLAATSKGVQVAGLLCAALTMILLMAPAAFHRITFGGEDSEEMHRIGSLFVTSAALPLGLSIGANAYVATIKLTASPLSAAALAAALCGLLFCLWYATPLFARRSVGRIERTRNPGPTRRKA
jgi:Family of unknown function (DUF6328)